jgi:hypothetical protein
LYDTCKISPERTLFQTITITDAHPARTYALFEMRADVSYHVFLLEPGSEVYLQIQNMIAVQPVLTVTSESLAEISVTKTRAKEKCSREANGMYVSRKGAI